MSSSAFMVMTSPKLLSKCSGIGDSKQTKILTPTRTPSAEERREVELFPLLHQEKRGGFGCSLNRREALAGLGVCLLMNAVGQQTAKAAAGEQCIFTVAPSGLEFCDRVVGTGPEASKGQLIKAHYVGKLENGKIFDSSYNRGKPLTFRVGVGEVIKGWDQGILGGDGIPPMLAGGKRTLKLPPGLGYGARGAGCKGGSCIIPPDSVLLFDVEFVGKA
ncbi:peptidyl-prolyl cis-trans isomerase FKBP13, chloroplastic [Aristolochia californica]|uniref:peptidyl-prolyl cis-trans isomerase FKBP13, chloroplastic n=1 Tax=Aristolochia californica TaxID=171875 RepID=UPI0035D54D0E